MEKLVERPWPKNAKPYVSKLKPIFAAQKVPGELIWIAEVESSFDPRARSPVGAAGLFQLMPETARHYGLRTRFIDERLQPEPSAEAAAKYLRHLYVHYKDWRLALAAYNAGEGTVDRLLAKQKKKNFDAIARKLPAETQMYVPGWRRRFCDEKGRSSTFCEASRATRIEIRSRHLTRKFESSDLSRCLATGQFCLDLRQERKSNQTRLLSWGHAYSEAAFLAVCSSAMNHASLRCLVESRAKVFIGLGGVIPFCRR